jgi:hypothetical protein
MLPPSLASLSVAHNHLARPPANFRGTLSFHNNGGMDRREFVDQVIQRFQGNEALTDKTIYNDAQNVHDSTVQESVRKSVLILLAMKPEESKVEDYVALLEARTNVAFLGEWATCPTTIGTSGARLSDLLERAYVIASLHEFSSEIFNRLSEELRDGEHICFTGKVSRIVNAFYVFVPGIEIRISPRAELHCRIQVLLARRCTAFAEARQELLRVLAGFQGMSEEESEAWVDPHPTQLR